MIRAQCPVYIMLGGIIGDGWPQVRIEGLARSLLTALSLPLSSAWNEGMPPKKGKKGGRRGDDSDEEPPVKQTQQQQGAKVGAPATPTLPFLCLYSASNWLAHPARSWQHHRESNCFVAVGRKAPD